MPSVRYAWIAGSIDDRMITAMRLFLAVAALLIIYIDPSEPDRYVALTYVVLTLYVIYSATLFFVWQRISSWLATMAHWADVWWYTVLIGLSSGTNSVFFFFFFFAIVIASLRWGFRSGLRVACVSAALFSIIGFATTSGGADFALNHLLLRPVSLLVFGYLMACWGESEVALKRRLALLKDINTLSNPRFGIDRMLGSIMEQLRVFYDADVCLLITVDPLTQRPSLRRVDRRDPEAATRSEPIAEELARPLLALPATQALVTRSMLRLWRWWCSEAGVRAYDVATGAGRVVPPQLSEALAVESFMTAPFCPQRETSGRIYLTTSRQRAFDISHIHFLLQVIAHVMPTLENIRLVDQLASTAAEAERQRIARDLHDSVIQPYIGLQMGLTALYQKFAAGDTDLGEDLKQLCALTDIGIASLRCYRGALRDSSEPVAPLLPAVRRFAERFASATGIAVHVEAKIPLSVSDRLAAEVFQMVAEGLSNVRRHTSSAQATISLACCNGTLSLRIANEVGAGAASTPFSPRSITERATALGGCTRVEQSARNGTVVMVDIPL